ncbi:MAG TPA: DNA/RNA non-specific endonuclease [Pyrinomonadaceae bacterium]|nr:DNA/RNA non-specific endonuclease [Pyrinomonadaceae bacterium]
MFAHNTRRSLRRTRRPKSHRPALKRTWRIIGIAIALALVSLYVAFAAISVSTTVPYTQSFNGMGIPISSPTPSTLPADFRVDTISAVRTLGSFGAASTQTLRVGGANVSTTAANGSYNFGAGTSTLGDADRAPGFISSGTATMSGNLYAQLTNNTGSPLSGLTISYDVEKYRNGSNPAGFRVQLFYSNDGLTWTNAGPDFLTSFAPNADNTGFTVAPGETQSVVSKNLNVAVANGANFFLAWNYSVTSGSTTTNAQALAIDNVSILGLGAVSPTNPTGTGAANPNNVLAGENTVLTVNVTPGANPTSTGITVTADLSSIGGAAVQQFFDDGINGGDAAAGDNVFTYTATVASLTTGGVKSLPFSISDAQARSGSGSISLTVQQPPPPVDHLVISQLYGGGGNTGATFTNDYVEIYNPTGVAFNLAGWSLQYASAAGTSWTNKQPLGGTVAPGEYFLVALASGGVNGSALPVSANITGDINMSATTGKLALVSNSVNLSGACPNGSDPDIVDFLGYGSSATCFEGATRAPAPSNTSAVFRKLNGAQDTNQNGDDFQTGAPNPRRTAPIVELGPWVAGTDPITDGFNAPYDATVTIDFSEPVDVTGSWFDITCTTSGQHNSATVVSYNGAKGYHITPNTSFTFGEQCTVTVFHANVHDQDLDDAGPNTDTLFADHSWTFTVVAAGAPAPFPSSVHLAFGNPSNAVADAGQPNNYLMEKPSFSLSYNRDKGTPNWVSWHLENTWTGNLPRNDTFRADPAVSADWYRVQSTDYFASGFDRGHMTPNADRDNPASIPLNQETFLMSNMVPQAPDNNQGPWADLESFLRTLLPANEVYIVAGPAGAGGSGDNGPANTIANGHVTVPAFTWKVAMVLPNGDDDLSRVSGATRTIAVIMPNSNSINSDWHTYLTTVDAVEALTGYDFFANVPDAVENSIEAGIDGNNPPGTENQSATTDEDVPASITLNAASPLASPSFSYTIVDGPANGVVSGSGLNLTYTPAPNFHGADTFTFRVNDGSQDSNTSTVTVTINPVNDAPTADSQSVSTNSNTPVSVTLTGTDLETADLVFEVTSGPTHGSLSGTGANVTYTPAANYSGPDSFNFVVRDSGDGMSPSLASAEATLSITVNDTVAPSIIAPANVTVGTGEGAVTCGTTVSEAQLGTPTASDNSGSVSFTRDGVPSGNVFPVGTTTVTYTATDNAGNTASATQTVTVIDDTAPALTAPAPTTVAPLSGTATIPNVVAGATSSDNCGAVTVTQSPLAGTVVGLGTHTITLTATDSAGNTTTATTTFTVNSGGFTFAVSTSPSVVGRGKLAKVNIDFSNTTTDRLSVTFVVRYSSPCETNVLLENVGPLFINPASTRSTNVNFHVPKTACVGPYTFTVDAFVDGAPAGTKTADLTVSAVDFLKRNNP